MKRIRQYLRARDRIRSLYSEARGSCFELHRHYANTFNVKQWGHSYLVVDADYTTLGITEEYIDITDVL